MTMLHIVNKSPFERVSFGSCLQHAQAGDSILMIEDAAVGAIQNTRFAAHIIKALKDKSVYVLSGDLAARGLSQERLIPGVKPVDYAGFVDLTVEHDKTQSWL